MGTYIGGQPYKDAKYKPYAVLRTVMEGIGILDPNMNLG
jgi:hypothetical protein